MKEIGKWAWAKQKCHEANIPKAEKIANELDKKLTEIYGTTITKDFTDNLENLEKDYDKKGLEILVYVSAMRQFCIACIIEKYDCKNCKFGEKLCYELISEFQKIIVGEDEDIVYPDFWF